MRCGGSPYDMDRLTPDPVTDVEMKRYHERIRSNPEEFVRVADIFREAHANVAARKLEKGRAA